MSSGADLFVVCKQCGAQVSPYITECPYCGNRLRRRAPKLPRSVGLQRSARTGERLRRAGVGTRQRPGMLERILRLGRSDQAAGLGLARPREGALLGSRPWATFALVIAACGLWIATRGGFVELGQLAIEGPLHGQWWRLFSSLFVYGSGIYAFIVLFAVAIFGWLLERRHGPLIVLLIFLGAGATGGLVALAISSDPVAVGANGAALGLIGAWAVPDLLAARARTYYDGDLLGVTAISVTLLAMPLARTEVSWSAGVAGGIVGLVLGFGLRQMSSAH